MSPPRNESNTKFVIIKQNGTTLHDAGKRSEHFGYGQTDLQMGASEARDRLFGHGPTSPKPCWQRWRSIVLSPHPHPPRQESKDGTVKYLWELADGNCIETVLMRYHHGNTVCVSTQVGCRMGCAFCASTLAGKVRDLTGSEMLDQVKFTPRRRTSARASPTSC